MKTIASEKDLRVARFRRIVAGEILIPLRCEHCHSARLMGAITQMVTARGMEVDAYECNACGRLTPVHLAHRLHKNEIRHYITTGEEPHR